jgi:type I restriction enzyme S subunit
MNNGWETKDLGAVSAISYGYTDSASSEPVGPKFLRITDIQDDQVNWEQVPYCRIESADLPKYRLANGDIVFARTGATTGKSFLVAEPPKAVFASYLIRLRLQDKRLLPEFVSLFFQTDGYWKSIKDGSTGSAQGGFNATKLAGLSIPIPPPPEQKRIVGILDEAFEGIATAKANAEKNLQNARALFESHLQSVFTRRGVGGEETRRGSREYFHGSVWNNVAQIRLRARWHPVGKSDEHRGFPHCPVEQDDGESRNERKASHLCLESGGRCYRAKRRIG